MNTTNNDEYITAYTCGAGLSLIVRNGENDTVEVWTDKQKRENDAKIRFSKLGIIRTYNTDSGEVYGYCIKTSSVTSVIDKLFLEVVHV